MCVHCSKFTRSHGARGGKQTSLSACRQGLRGKNHVQVHSRGRGGSQLLWPQTLAPPLAESPQPAWQLNSPGVDAERDRGRGLERQQEKETEFHQERSQPIFVS